VLTPLDISLPDLNVEHRKNVDSIVAAIRESDLRHAVLLAGLDTYRCVVCLKLGAWPDNRSARYMPVAVSVLGPAGRGGDIDGEEVCRDGGKQLRGGGISAVLRPPRGLIPCRLSRFANMPASTGRLGVRQGNEVRSRCLAPAVPERGYG
jgi:hypothetical protein